MDAVDQIITGSFQLVPKVPILTQNRRPNINTMLTNRCDLEINCGKNMPKSYYNELQYNIYSLVFFPTDSSDSILSSCLSPSKP